MEKRNKSLRRFPNYENDDLSKKTIVFNKSYAVPCNPNYYDIDKALKDLKCLWYGQIVKDVCPGDIIYIYVGKPIQAYKYKCIVLEANVLLSNIDVEEDEEYTKLKTNFSEKQKFMRIQFLEEGFVPLKEIISNVDKVKCAPISQMRLKDSYLHYVENRFDQHNF